MKNAFLVITSIAGQTHPILRLYANESSKRNIPFIVIGDTKSPDKFSLEGCDFYPINRQKKQDFQLAKILPEKHYARKNLGYLIAMSKGAEIIIETDDDNIPLESFWNERLKNKKVFLLKKSGWVNVYKYFTNLHIWPRGLPLEEIQTNLPNLENETFLKCPIQQGLANENPDVDALYRLIFPLPASFEEKRNVALKDNSWCPFNSQNTTWFKEAFPLMYLPSYCSFRMTDIWRSFIAQRIAWTCGWPILFHESTVKQERNEHNIKKDFEDELPGYMHNATICQKLKNLELPEGVENIPRNMTICYNTLIESGFIDKKEMSLLSAWMEDILNI